MPSVVLLLLLAWISVSLLCHAVPLVEDSIHVRLGFPQKLLLSHELTLVGKQLLHLLKNECQLQISLDPKVCAYGDLPLQDSID